MNYAKNNYIGKNQPPTAKKTKKVARATRRVYELDAKTKRCRRDSERQTKICPCGNASNGFLKTSFLPKLYQTKTVQACKRSAKIQRDFYKCLSHLAEHYNIVPMQTKDFEYPYNLALAISDIEEKLKECILNCPEIRLVQDSEKTYFVSEEKYNTGTTLYYIPIQPLYQMLHDPKHKKSAQLLVSVCSYLYHIADIPYYRQPDSYLYWMYEMHREWTEQDEEREENERYVREFDRAELIGDCIEQKIFNRMNLQFFKKRLNSFKSRNVFDKQCIELAGKAFELWMDYPSENIFRNAPLHNEDKENGQENESIAMEKYISFIYDTKGWLYESIAESINNEFNEYGAMDEPIVYKSFDKADIANNSLDFESRLFSLLDDLCELLYNYKQPENE
jgi:hypothetical protein